MLQQLVKLPRVDDNAGSILGVGDERIAATALDSRCSPGLRLVEQTATDRFIEKTREVYIEVVGEGSVCEERFEVLSARSPRCLRLPTSKLFKSLN